jgi:hypothetical protein
MLATPNRFIVSLILFLLVVRENIAQPPFPALVRTITFSELVASAEPHEVTWTNPDGTQERMTITQMAIPADEKMKELIRIYESDNYGRNSIWLDPKMIVFHAMGDGDLKTSLEVSSFLSDRIPGDWGSLSQAGALPNGAHFIIDKNGDIICLTPPLSADGKISYATGPHRWLVRRHQDGNPVAIGIENVTDRGDLTGLTRKQVESDAQLTRWLIVFENNQIRFLASHHQFNNDENEATFLRAFGLVFLQKNNRTRGRKDIGNQNLEAIISQVKRKGYMVQSFFGR